MPTNKKLPWDFVIDLIFKEYWSKEFYAKFKANGRIFTPEIEWEWISNYMWDIGMVHQDEFFRTIDSWKPKYDKKYNQSAYPTYEAVIAHILPLCAPTFFEQDKLNEYTIKL